MDDIGRWCLFLLFLILSFLFCAAKTALSSYNESKLEELADGHKNSEKLLHLLKTHSESRQVFRMETSHLICVMAACAFGMILGLAYLEAPIQLLKQMILQPALQSLVAILMIIAAFLAVVCLILAFSHVLPKRIFQKKAESFLLSFYPMVRKASFLFYPVGGLASLLGSGVARLFGYRPSSDNDAVTEEEIRNMVDAGGETGVLEQEEREMINNIFDFDDKDVSDLMTHRTDIVGLELHAKISDVVYHAINDGFSRIPVYENDLDNIKGIIYVKDLLCLVGCTSSEDFQIQDFLREAIYVPEAKRCSDLLKIFKTKKAHMAVVVDDYGGTAGIVTMEDLLESIVGNIQDEYDDEQEAIVPLEDGSYLLDGSTDLEEMEKFFHLHFDVDEDIDTVGGLITNTLGAIPGDDEQPELTIECLHLKVISVQDQRIERVKATVLTENNQNQTAE